MGPIKVMVIDDSAVMGQVMSEMLRLDPDIEIMAVETDAQQAYERLLVEAPDVVVLDADIPSLDCIGFLRRIMRERPLPVVISAPPSPQGWQVAVAALSTGAVNVVNKPKTGLKRYLQENSSELIAEVKAAALANVARILPVALMNVPPKLGTDSVIGPLPVHLPTDGKQLVAIGGSTGGIQTLERILIELPRLCPGMVIVQHMRSSMHAAFVQHLNSICDLEVKLAEQGDRVCTGLALVAPAGRHLQVRRSRDGLFVTLSDGVFVNGCKPAIDVMFRSVAAAVGPSALGVIVTGTGADGAQGLKALHDAGAVTLAEDQTTCVAQELPRLATQLRAVSKSVRRQALAREIQAYAERV